MDKDKNEHKRIFIFETNMQVIKLSSCCYFTLT
jgi:hypothetical protein